MDAGWAMMRAGLRAAASAAATAGRMEGMSTGCRLGAGGLGGPGRDLAAPAGRSGRQRRGREARGCGLLLLGLAGSGPAMCEVVWVGVRGGEQFAWVAFRGRGGVGLGLLGCVRGAWAGHWVGCACRGARGSSRRVCVGCRVWGVVRGVRRVGVWRACAGVRAGGGGPCRGARGCARCWACVGLRVSSERGGAICGDCAVGCVVWVYVSARRGALAWPVVGRAVWRRSLPSSAAAARISQTSLRIWWTSWSVVGRGYASFGLRPARLRTLWMAWYPQVRDCCGLGGGGFDRVSGPASTCVWAVGMAQTQGTVPVGGQRRSIQWIRQSMANPRW